jgi:hypothetical protein
MSADAIAWRVVPNFEQFVLGNSPEDSGPGQRTCLADFIRLWMEKGDGVRCCLGDYHTYLIGVIVIADKWSRDPTVLDYPTPGGPQIQSRRVSELLSNSPARDILDPDFFAARAYNYAHRPNRDTEPQ